MQIFFFIFALFVCKYFYVLLLYTVVVWLKLIVPWKLESHTIEVSTDGVWATQK